MTEGHFPRIRDVGDHDAVKGDIVRGIFHRHLESKVVAFHSDHGSCRPYGNLAEGLALRKGSREDSPLGLSRTVEFKIDKGAV